MILNTTRKKQTNLFSTLRAHGVNFETPMEWFAINIIIKMEKGLKTKVS